MAKKFETVKVESNGKKLLVIVVNRGFAEEVVDKSRLDGATGATILHGRGSAYATETFLGLNITPEKEVVLIVIDEKFASAAMTRISETLGVKTNAGGVCFCVPVNAMTKKIMENPKE